MGKIIKAIAIIAIAAAVIYFAPAIAPFLTHLGLSAGLASAISSAVVATAISAGVSAAFSLFAGRPSATTAPGRQRTKGQPLTQTGLTRAYPPAPTTPTLCPIRRYWLSDPHFFPWERFTIIKVAGNCMGGLVARYAIVDREALIRAGDLIEFTPDDLREYETAAGLRRRSAGLVKRFVGVDNERRVMVFETTNPPNRAETGIDRLLSAARVRATTNGWYAAQRLLRAVRRDPAAFDGRLAA